MHQKPHPPLLLSLLCSGLVACPGASEKGTGDSGTGDTGGVEAYVVKGRVTDAAGHPLSGIDIYAEAFSPVPQTGTTVTGADGRYRILLDRAKPGVFSVSARRHFTYNGNGLALPFEPTDTGAFAQNEGAVRDFVWPGLVGELGSGAATTSTLFIDGRGSSVWEAERTEVTLEPLTPLLDGSTGRTIVEHPVNGAEGVGLYAVPYARYRASARYNDAERGWVQMCVREVGNSDDRNGSLSATADFRPVYSILTLELELGVPEAGQDCD